MAGYNSFTKLQFLPDFPQFANVAMGKQRKVQTKEEWLGMSIDW